MVNPYDVEGVAEAIHRAFFMDTEERTSRMKKLRTTIKKKDIFWWVNHFLEVAMEKHLPDFPAEEYVPVIPVENNR